MSAAVTPQLSKFAQDILSGLEAQPKRLSPRYFYDDLGSTLFEAITLLPQYGLTRADERLLQRYAIDIVRHAGSVRTVAELGSGSGKKTRHILSAFSHPLTYLPIDVSSAALQACARELGGFADVKPVCSDWLEGLAQIASSRPPDDQPMMLLFLGSSVGNIDRRELPHFFQQIRNVLRAGDTLLLGADLVKERDVMVGAYDDPLGVTAAFNLNALQRINFELDADFDLHEFKHEARWNANQRAIEMHLVARSEQFVEFPSVGRRIHFHKGESIWTESSHKFETCELESLAERSGFAPVQTWVDGEWPFAEALWLAD